MKKTIATGECFARSMSLLASLKHQGLKAELAHGIPLGNGGDAKGLRYWHAWVEQGNVCIDPEGAIVPRHVYYAQGHIEHVWTYTLDEALEEAMDSGHWGPWVGADKDEHWHDVLFSLYPDVPIEDRQEGDPRG